MPTNTRKRILYIFVPMEKEQQVMETDQALEYLFANGMREAQRIWQYENFRKWKIRYYKDKNLSEKTKEEILKQFSFICKEKRQSLWYISTKLISK